MVCGVWWFLGSQDGPSDELGSVGSNSLRKHELKQQPPWNRQSGSTDFRHRREEGGGRRGRETIGTAEKGRR